MPHVLYRLSTGKFIFDEYKQVSSSGDYLLELSAWSERHTGGSEDGIYPSTLDDPSFIGQKIQNIFFHKNRVGFLTRDNIILSRTGEYGDFFIQTKQEVLDDDPIDLAVASKDVAILRHVVSTAGQLIIFSDDTQFLLSSDGVLTPNSAEITGLSNYTYDPIAEAKAIGNRVYFINKTGGYSQVYAYKVTDEGSRLTEATNLTIHLPNYISNRPTKIVGHSVLGHVFFQDENNPNVLFVLNTVDRHGQELQNAFHKWEFAKEVVSVNVINNDLYILFRDHDLCKMTLEIPGDILTPIYGDLYSNSISRIPYKSFLEFSQFFLRDGNGKGSPRGRYQLRTMEYVINKLSKYKTTIINTAYVLNGGVNFGPLWLDFNLWNDDYLWVETFATYSADYYNDEKITVATNSEDVKIIFSSSDKEEEQFRGFELATVNIEAFFYQRSRRT
jgi:hypothetical protein